MTSFAEKLHWLATPEVCASLKGMLRGIERECLRVTPDGAISQKKHPSGLGSTLCHDSITTDYSEALTEIITQPHACIEDCLTELNHLHGFVHSQLDDELLWPMSMPPALNGEEDIPIADYGASLSGTMKHVYRRGLAVRYGRKMQSIAGIHYNVSFPDEFWQLYQQAFSVPGSLRNCKDQMYFSTVRQFLRHGWILTLLTGASPACHTSFVEPTLAAKKNLQRHHDYYLASYACSLRMGGLGYHNDAQSGLFICYDSLEQYTHTLGNALQMPSATYEQAGLFDQAGNRHQISTNVLQIENEFYGSIRPKQPTASMERPTVALEQRGVAYIEIRNLDVDFNSPAGINEITAAMTEIFITGCLLENSALLKRKDNCVAAINNEQVAMLGRCPVNDFIAVAQKHWQTLAPIARILDKVQQTSLYSQAFDYATHLLENPEELNSSQMVHLLQQRKGTAPYMDIALDFSQQHRDFFQSNPLPFAINAALEKKAQQSLMKFEQLPAVDEQVFESAMKEYFRDLPTTQRQDCAALTD